MLHNSGGLTEYTCKNGKVLKIKYLDLKAMSEYENRLQNKAVQKLNEHRNIMDKQFFSDMFKDLLDRIAPPTAQLEHTHTRATISADPLTEEEWLAAHGDNLATPGGASEGAN